VGSKTNSAVCCAALGEETAVLGGGRGRNRAPKPGSVYSKPNVSEEERNRHPPPGRRAPGFCGGERGFHARPGESCPKETRPPPGPDQTHAPPVRKGWEISFALRHHRAPSREEKGPDPRGDHLAGRGDLARPRLFREKKKKSFLVKEAIRDSA